MIDKLKSALMKKLTDTAESVKKSALMKKLTDTAESVK